MRSLARATSMVVGILALALGCGSSRPANPGSDGGAGDAAADLGTSADAASDGAGAADTGATAATCEGAVAVDVCGCGCCGGQATSLACYYPALGQAASGIPDPRPADCSTVGCSFGVRHLCCADPGATAPPLDAGSGAPSYCAYDPATDLPRIVVERRDGATCVSVRLIGPDQPPPTSGAPIPGWVLESATRGPCDGSGVAEVAVGGIGSMSIRHDLPGDGVVDVHLAVFFPAASGAGAAAAVRLDVAALALSVGACPR